MGKKKLQTDLREGYQPLQKGYVPQAAPQNVKPPTGESAVVTPVNQSTSDGTSSGSDESKD